MIIVVRLATWFNNRNKNTNKYKTKERITKVFKKYI